MFTVDYAEGYANLPRLLSDDNLVPDDTRACLLKRVVRTDSEGGRLYIADNLDSIVEFGYIEKGGKWWSSRPGCFNTTGVLVNGVRLTGKIAIVAVSECNRTAHYRLDFIRQKIAECNQDIRFFRITEFENREIYYIPYEPSKREYVFNKLEQDHSVNSIEDMD